MSPKEFRVIEGKVLKWIETARRPIRTSELLKQKAGRISPHVLRRAIWSLVSDGKAEYTSDRCVRVPSARSRG